jgi:hypothetical protein
MNKRINELAVEAGAQWRGGYVEQPNGDSVWQDRAKVDIADMDLAKFTEFLLDEAADEIREIDGNDYQTELFDAFDL